MWRFGRGGGIEPMMKEMPETWGRGFWEAEGRVLRREWLVLSDSAGKLLR